MFAEKWITYLVNEDSDVSASLSKHVQLRQNLRILKKDIKDALSWACKLGLEMGISAEGQL